MVPENGAYLKTPSDTARFRAVSVPSYSRIFQPQATHISFVQHLLSPKTVSFSPIFHRALTMVFLARAVPKNVRTFTNALTHTLLKATVFQENFNSLLKTWIQQHSFQSRNEATLQVQFLYHGDYKTARECELESFSETHHGYQGTTSQTRNGQPCSGSGFQKNYQMCSRTHLPPCLHF